MFAYFFELVNKIPLIETTGIGGGGRQGRGRGGRESVRAPEAQLQASHGDSQGGLESRRQQIRLLRLQQARFVKLLKLNKI